MNSGGFEKNFAHASHAVDDVSYKIEWCTKYGFKMLRQERLAAACEAAIREVAAKHKLIIVELSIMPEHVHCIVRAFARYSIAYVTQLLKGGSSYLLFKQFPQLRLRYPKGHFWSAGKARQTIGRNIDDARNYVTAPHNDRYQTKLQGYPGL